MSRCLENVHCLYASLQHTIYLAALILLRSIYGSRKAGVYVDTTMEMKDVQKCMDALEDMQTR